MGFRRVRALQAKKSGSRKLKTPDAFVRVMSVDITFVCICQSYVHGHNLSYFGHNFKSMDITFAVLSYFQKSRLDLTFVDLSLTHIWT